VEELDKVDIIDRNNVFILNSHGYVKNILRDYQRSFKDFDNANVLKSKNAFTFSKRNFVLYKQKINNYMS
jgi:hypothetical protein